MEALLVDHVAKGNFAGVQSCLKDLKKRGPEAPAVVVKSSEFGGRGSKSALHTAASFGRAEIIRHLLATKVDPNSMDDAGNTPLHLATISGHARVAQALLELGADCNAQNAFGTKPLDKVEVNTWDSAEVEHGKASIRRMMAGEQVPINELRPEPIVKAATGEKNRRAPVVRPWISLFCLPQDALDSVISPTAEGSPSKL